MSSYAKTGFLGMMKVTSFCLHALFGLGEMALRDNTTTQTDRGQARE